MVTSNWVPEWECFLVWKRISLFNVWLGGWSGASDGGVVGVKCGCSWWSWVPRRGSVFLLCVSVLACMCACVNMYAADHYTEYNTITQSSKLILLPTLSITLNLKIINNEPVYYIKALINVCKWHKVPHLFKCCTNSLTIICCRLCHLRIKVKKQNSVPKWSSSKNTCFLCLILQKN